MIVLLLYYLKMLSTTVLGISSFVIFVFYFFNLPNQCTVSILRCFKKIPGPKGWPILGSVILFWGSSEDIFNVTREMARKYSNGIYKVWALNLCAVNIYTPEDMETVLSSTKLIMKSDIYDMLHPWLNTGLLTANGEKWKVRRRLLTPAFHFNILKEFVDIFDEESTKIVEKLRPECSKSSTSIIPFITEYALYSLCETTMGYKVQSGNQQIQSYKRAIYLMGESNLYQLCRPWLRVPFLFHMTKYGKIAQQALKVLHKFTTDVINERLVNWDTDSKRKTFETASGKLRCAMLNTLISQMKDGATIDIDGLREEVDTFMFEGHDTTSTGMTFFLLHLANEPEIQDKIFEELCSIFGSTYERATYENLQEMVYLEMCLKEALRICPPVPFISRKITEEVVLSGHRVVPGPAVHLHIYDLHHNPQVWPDPEKFDPERFSPENVAKRHPFAYVPFSAGSRNCIGQKFAILEIKSFISKVLWNFKLETVDTPDSVRYVADLVLRSKGEIRLRFKLRDHLNK